MQAGRAVDAVRRPEYTGANRCLPCTVFNLAMVGIAAASVAVVDPYAALPVVAVGVLLVAVRGYVVPGTPSVTRRYLPDRAHRWTHRGTGSTNADSLDFDPESTLLAAGALVPCPDGDDRCLDPSFRAAWRQEMTAVDVDLGDAFHTMLPANVGAYAEVGRRGNAVLGRVADTTVVEWPSRAAFVADAAAAATLADADPAWHDRRFEEQTQLLAALRLWLTQCPVCDGRVELGDDTVESCCLGVPVRAASCASCGARLYEAPERDA